MPRCFETTRTRNHLQRQISKWDTKKAGFLDLGFSLSDQMPVFRCEKNEQRISWCSVLIVEVEVGGSGIENDMSVTCEREGEKDACPATTVCTLLVRYW